MPAVERLAFADVEGLRVGRFRSQINTTCILYRLGETVIDTGPPNQWRTVRRFLAERRVRRVVVTHHHEDHGGNLAAIGRAHRADLFSPPEGIGRLAGGFPLEWYRRLIWGAPDRVEAAPLPVRLDLEGGWTLEPLAAPGHSTDMTCFLEPGRGWLFTGDLYISSRLRYLRADEDLPAMIESLRRVLERDFATVLCSHRGVVEDGKAALGRKLDYLLELCGRARELAAAGRDLRAITRELLGAEDAMSRLTRYHFSKRNLIAGCLRDTAAGGRS